MTGPFGTTGGPWHWVENAMSNGNPNKPEYFASGEPALMAGDQMVCWFGDSEKYYPTSGIEPSDGGKCAIAQVPAMLELVQRICAMAEKGGRYETGPLPDFVEDARAIARRLEEK